MRSNADALSEVHQIAGQAQGEIALALSAKRGVTRTKLREWASWFQQASEILLEHESSLPAPTPKEPDE